MPCPKCFCPDCASGRPKPEPAPTDPIPSAEAIERIKRLRAIVRDNPPPPEKD